MLIGWIMEVVVVVYVAMMVMLHDDGDCELQKQRRPPPIGAELESQILFVYSIEF